MQDPKGYKGEEEFYSRQGKLDVKRPIWRRYLWPLIACIALLLVVVFASTTIYLLVNHAPGTPVVTVPQTGAATPMVPTQIPPTLVPTAPPATLTPTPTPKIIPENRNIPCLNCQGGNYALTLKVSTITIDYANQQTIMKYTLTNIGTVGCTVIFDKLEFQDDNGTIFKAQNVGQSIVDIAVTNSFIASSTFDLIPQPNTHYLLTTSIDCTNRIDFKNQDFVFN